MDVRSHWAFRTLLTGLVVTALAAPGVHAGGGGWIDFQNATGTRLVAAANVGAGDVDEKDYAWDDLDQDGDIDLVCVRKQPFTTPGGRRNVLFMNEGIAEGHAINGVLVDRTSQYASAADDGGQGFLDLTNDRDVIIVDVNNDGWPDVVTVATLSDGLAKTLSHPRVYMNLGNDLNGDWQGLFYEQNRIPQLFTIGTNRAVAPRLCAVSAGDVTGDGFVDLYIGDYDSGGVGGGFPEDPANDVDDRLLINDGTGHFVDSLETRMSAGMLLSAFNMATAIADMNGDGFLDVVKDTALNFPQRVSISYNDPANEGFFDDLDVVDGNSPYHITVGDLNRDGRLDIVVTDDGRDHYWLNTGNGPDGLANFVRLDFQRFAGSDNEFGGNSIIADLNNDGFMDVIIGDVDVDIDQNCSRRMHIYRNLGNLPNVTLREQSGAEPWTPNGTHDMAVFDINGDGWADLFIGHCTGTSVWINLPPISLVFAYPDGLPGDVLPDTPTTFRVAVSGTGNLPQPGTGKQFASVNGGPFVQTNMTEESPNVYFAVLPPAPCTESIDFYFTVETTTGLLVSEPGGAPANAYRALSTLGMQTLFEDRFETALPGWTVVNGAGLITGAWVRVDPLGTFFPTGSTTPAQPEDDFGAAAQETQCYITQQYSGTGGASNNDVDGGPTELISPVFDLAGTDAVVGYARWLFCDDQGSPDQDSLITEVNNGASGWVMVDETFGTGGVWEAVSFRVGDFVAPTATVQVRFRIGDVPNNSVTEAAIDNFKVDTIVCMDCQNNVDCDDGIACNGVETCVGGVCQPGVSPCTALGLYCDPIQDICVECLNDDHCNDFQFCNGIEVCVNGVCMPGVPPCPPGLVCDEVNDLCLGCLNNIDCDDGLFCNGVEICVNGECRPALIGVLNGTFDDATDWQSNIPVDGSIAFAGNLNVVGPDNSTGGFTWASQFSVDLGGSLLEFDLLSYSSPDTGDFDRPVFFVDGAYYGLNDNGTLGSLIPSPSQGAFGNIDNGNPVAATIHFVVDVEALVGPGLHDLGLGVMSADGQFGAGTAVFDTALPAAVPVDVCPGQFCDESQTACVECLTNSHCDDGLFCNGVEQCVGGVCMPGVPPCPPGECNEITNTCTNALQPPAGDPVQGLTAGELARFGVGQTRFDELLTQPNGLGPIFNQNSCAACHNIGGAGGSGSILVTRFGRFEANVFDPLANLGGSLLQAQSISPTCQEVVPPEANVTANRLTPQTFGIGLIEAIPGADILANVNNPPAGISGQAHMVPAFEDPPGAPLRVGRFGWKSQVATVLTFSADAALNEMGLTNRFLQTENDPNGVNPPSLGAPDFCDTVPDPEDGPEGGIPGNPEFIDRVTDFQRFLAPPPQTPRAGMSGESLFLTVGCADCHTPAFTTGVAAEAALSNKIIRPFSDFLLHDMGALGDGIEQGGAGRFEMRTAPLWGLRFRDSMLHDARVSGGPFDQRIRLVVNEHAAPGSEATASAETFELLTTPEQDAVIAFLDSLGRREFDGDGDSDVDPVDLSFMAACYTGPGSFYTPDDGCSVFDVDQDGDVDDDDVALFLTVYTGPQGDCNMNTIHDAIEIMQGLAGDCDLNGLPDECDPEWTDVGLFVAQLLAATPNPQFVCLYDGTGDGLLSGVDIPPFVARVLAP